MAGTSTSPTSDSRSTKTDAQLVAEAQRTQKTLEERNKFLKQDQDLRRKIGNFEAESIGTLAVDRYNVRTWTAKKKVAKDALDKALHPLFPPADPVLVAKALDYFNKTSAQLDKANAKLKSDLAELADLKAKWAKVIKAQKYVDFSKTNRSKDESNPKGTNPPATPTPPAAKPLYKYNAPMTKSAYSGESLQSRMAAHPSLMTGPGNRSDAKYNWITNTKTGNMAGSKGTVQMSRAFANLAPKPSSKSNIVDDQLYGFKFLYNPTTVSMAWGIVEQFSPQFEASGQDKASAVSVGLMKSAITFSLMLNRIDDMNFIIDTGNVIVDGEDNPDTVYPYTFSEEEGKEIYKKGTMYDLEYLFKATGGYSASYKSTLNGKTADKGWLNPIPVELHLGDGLRYLVRLSSLDVNHIIFNERMVPILTTVNLTFTRYYDGPEMFQNSQDAFGIIPTTNSEVIK